MVHDRRTFLAAGAATLAGLALGGRANGAAYETVLNNSFANYGALDGAWNYRYPWGSDHNGTARMYASPSDRSHVYLESGGVLVVKADRVNGDEGKSNKDPYLPIHYRSGALHAKQQLLVDAKYPSWDVKGEFQVPTAKGTWPAFWLTAVHGWPPESDIVEFKGDGRNWFNTFRTPSDVSNAVVGVSSPGSWHAYRAWITKVNATDVDIHYYLDGKWIAQHRGTNFVGKPMWLILNLQMEGSSGSPGPTSPTFFRARNVYMGREPA